MTNLLLLVYTAYCRKAGHARVWMWMDWGTGRGGKGQHQPSTAEPALPAEY